MSQHEITARSLLAEVMGLSADAIADNASIENEVAWDSLSHIRLMLRLESHLEATLDPESVLEITSLRGIAALLARWANDEDSITRPHAG
jgi:acyl carrier protein